MAARTRAEKMEETRIRLIAAARQAFAAKGYAGASMDELTADAGLTRGALYHNFGDKRGLLAAVVDQIDTEMSEAAREAGLRAGGGWAGLMAEGAAYARMALRPEVQRIVLLDGPAVLGDPAQWPSQNRCLEATIATLRQLEAEGQLRPVDIEAAARLLNGMALNAALWVAAADQASGGAGDQAAQTLPKAITALETLAAGLLRPGALPG